MGDTNAKIRRKAMYKHIPVGESEHTVNNNNENRLWREKTDENSEYNFQSRAHGPHQTENIQTKLTMWL